MKNKMNFLSIMTLLSLPMISYSQELSTLLNPASSGSKGSVAVSFEASREKMMEFHAQKIMDHQKVLDCLKDSNGFESMNACNKHLEKYLKKNVEAAKNQEESQE